MAMANCSVWCSCSLHGILLNENRTPDLPNQTKLKLIVEHLAGFDCMRSLCEPVCDGFEFELGLWIWILEGKPLTAGGKCGNNSQTKPTEWHIIPRWISENLPVLITRNECVYENWLAKLRLTIVSEYERHAFGIWNDVCVSVQGLNLSTSRIFRKPNANANCEMSTSWNVTATTTLEIQLIPNEFKIEAFFFSVSRRNSIQSWLLLTVKKKIQKQKKWNGCNGKM